MVLEDTYKTVQNELDQETDIQTSFRITFFLILSTGVVSCRYRAKVSRCLANESFSCHIYTPFVLLPQVTLETQWATSSQACNTIKCNASLFDPGGAEVESVTLHAR